MECVIVHDLFLNETANYAHVFLPGSTFLEKDGTFTNAERRINRVRQVMKPKNGLADWEVTQKLAQAMGARWSYIASLARSWTRSPRRRRASPASATTCWSAIGSVQWPCNEKAPHGTPVMHIGGFVRGKGRFMITEYVATDERTGPRFPLLLTTGRILSASTMSARRRAAPPMSSGTTRTCWRSIRTMPSSAASATAISSGSPAAPAKPRLRATMTDRVAPGVVYTTFHHPDTQANVITTDYSDWATNCPEYKVTAVQVSPSNGPSQWQVEYEELSKKARRIEHVAEPAE